MSSNQHSNELTIDQGVVLAPVLTGASHEVSVVLVPERARFSLRVKPSNLKALSEASELDLPEKIGASTLASSTKILCLGPDERLVVSDVTSGGTLRRMFAELSSQISFSYADISHRNVAFEISGARAVKLLNTGCPLDLCLRAFPVGKCTRTVFEHAEITLLREGEYRFYVELWRSFAPYFVRLLEKAVKSR